MPRSTENDFRPVEDELGGEIHDFSAHDNPYIPWYILVIFVINRFLFLTHRISLSTIFPFLYLTAGLSPKFLLESSPHQPPIVIWRPTVPLYHFRHDLHKQFELIITGFRGQFTNNRHYVPSDFVLRTREHEESSLWNCMHTVMPTLDS